MAATEVAGSGGHRMLNADDIIPRNIRFNIAEAPKRHWYGGNLHKTALVDAFSLFLPEGERFFIRSLKHYAAGLDDQELAREINGYAVQEAFHTREHEEYNRALASLGYDIETMEAPIRRALRSTQNPLLRLAVTCAIEHLTATFSLFLLRHPKMLDDAEPAYRRLWMWHALEEMEHKAVALDVFNHASRDLPAWKRYLLRISAMNGTVFGFIVLLFRNVRLYAKSDGVPTGIGFWLKFLGVLLIDPGYSRLTAFSFLSYYRPSFDPRQKDDLAIIESGRAWLAQEMGPHVGTATATST